MVEAMAGPAGRYALDGSDEDLGRLLMVANVNEGMARSAFRRVGVQNGWRVIDCGCRPVGALPVLSGLVGPAGRVVGIDFSEPTVERARSVAAALHLDNVEVVQGDVHEWDAAALGGPFDIAYTRLFLVHQADPVRTLRHIAGLLRPSGWIIAQEPLRSPAPRSHPHHDALGAYWDLLHRLVEQAVGRPRHPVEELARSARAAGLEVIAVDGTFATMDPELGFDLHASSLAAARERAAASGSGVEQQIDALVDELRAAKAGAYEWVSTPFYLDVTLRKPSTAASTS
jgi:SAM-dependent methyltransferase